MVNTSKVNIKKITLMQVLPHLDSGGLVSGAIEVAIAFKKAGGKSIVVSSGGYREKELKRHGCDLIYLNVNTKNPIEIFFNKNKLKSLIKENSVDIVHVRSRAPAWSVYLACKKMKIPFITTFHGTYKINNYFKKKYNSVMLKGNAVIAISSFIKEHIKLNYNHKKNIFVVPRGVNIDMFSPEKVTAARMIALAKKLKIEEVNRTILMPGRLTDWKGHKLVIKVLNLIKEKDIKLIIVGDAQKRKNYTIYLKKLARKLGVESKVIFQDHTIDLPAYMKLSDIVLSCSTKPEAFGRVILEAQAMGIPVVAFKHGGSIELVENNKNGLLANVGDLNDLASKIDQSLNYSINKRKQIARDSISSIKSIYLTSHMCDKTIKVYKKVLKEFNNNEKNLDY